MKLGWLYHYQKTKITWLFYLSKLKLNVATCSLSNGLYMDIYILSLYMDNERDDLGTPGILSSITDIPRIVKEVSTCVWISHVYE